MGLSSLFTAPDTVTFTMPLSQDLLHPSAAEEQRKHKKKRLAPSPNSFFMDVKCPGCFKITTAFSHPRQLLSAPDVQLSSAHHVVEKLRSPKVALSDPSLADKPDSSRVVV